MNLYGPSAATGIGGGGVIMWMTGSPVFAAMAIFALIGAFFALLRILPKLHLMRN